MDERELVDLISARLGTKPDEGRSQSGGRSEGRNPSDRSFGVDVEALTGYAREVEGMADELRTVGRNGVASVTGEGFGWVGRDSGFAKALKGFADSLTRQIVGTADNADRLGRAVGRTADAYRREDAEIAADLGKVRP
ncbi:type VII secretion target [Actinokineospora sp. NBRC 105648]|uniref:WXG100 family type VII secretion target n=1 Tax=Actinokineospora sp. NBRC 105648 TaxID=3032206 RepID=UPI0024A49C94|nr:type VII secretion target [Actinokineospora sp. NBRC 105648]GLZ39195.1 hypothetical protein Acsp05_28190 [Actinokineospora sp. NBRC 105648]